MFSKEQLAQLSKEQATHTSLTGRFLQLMGYGDKTKDGAISFGAQYDSLVANANEANIAKASFVPESLLILEENLKGKVLPNGKGSAFHAILDSIATGTQAYKNRHGGDMPSAGLVASALANASLLYKGLDVSMTGGMYDSANTGNQLAKEYFLDSVSAGASSHMAEVPALAMVTIATTIANAMPIVAYLPNPKGTQTVPLVYVRQVAKNNYGQTRRNEYLDGINAAGQYFDSVHRLALTTDVERKSFTVKAYRCVESAKILIPDVTSGRLPLVAGATTINVSGIPFATDHNNHGQGGATTGKLSLLPLSRDQVTIGNVNVRMISGEVDLDTDTITIVFDTAIPEGINVIANVVANYEAKDGNNTPILNAPSVDAKLEYSSVTAYAIRSIYVATIDALTQMQNELGVDMRSAFIAVVISKLMLEQNTRLLHQAKERAIGQGSVRALDLSRGSDMTQAFNNTSSIAAEIIPALEDSKRRVISRSTHTPIGFDVYVTGTLSTLMKSLADDTNFIPTGLTLGAPNNIVRIGSRGSDNFYYLPEGMGVLEEVQDVYDPLDPTATSTASELLLVARNGEPAKSVFVGHIAVPVLTDDVRANAFESGVQFYTRQASEVNKTDRFGGQVFVLKIFNLPSSLTTRI